MEIESDPVYASPFTLQLIRDYPDIAPILDDPRILIHIDDGRRWLRRHSAARFDLVVMNTTFHWRANVTNLLAEDFLRMGRSHLAPDGVLAFNATGSPDAFFTATQVFSHAYRWGNFVYASERDFRNVTLGDARARLLAIGGQALSTSPGAATKTLNAVDHVLATPFVTIEEASFEAGRTLETITVQNMITEYRYGRGL